VTNTVLNAGTTILNNTFILDNSYGNYEVTISAITYNSITEVFVGNYAEKVGEIFVLYNGSNNITKTVGFIGTDDSKVLDIVVYSKNTTTFQPFDIKTTTSCATTLICNEVVIGGTETFRENVTLNIVDDGYIIYNTENGQKSFFAPLGTYTISECIIVESLKSPSILDNQATFTITSSGTTCTNYAGQIGDCVMISFNASYTGGNIFWIDCNGIERKRGISAYENFLTPGIFGSATSSGDDIRIIYDELL
jgi:hypothetical protein